MTVTLSKIYTEGRRRGTKGIRTAGGTPPPPPPATPQECVRRAQGPQRSPTALGTGQHGAFPELPHPLTAGKPHFTPEVAVPAPRASQPHARGFADPLPAHAQARPGSASPPTASPPTASGSAATPGLHRPRKGAHSPVPSQGRAPRPPPPSVAESFPHNLPTEGRTAGGTGGARRRLIPRTRGGKRWDRSPGSSGHSPDLGVGAGLGPRREARAAGRAEGPRRGMGSGCREPPLFSATAAPAARPGPSHTRPLSHCLAVALGRPHPNSHTHSFPHTLVPTHTHTLTPSHSSLPHSPGVRARAPPLTLRARRRRRLPCAALDRGAACRAPARARARPGSAFQTRLRGGQGAAAGRARGRSRGRNPAPRVSHLC